MENYPARDYGPEQPPGEDYIEIFNKKFRGMPGVLTGLVLAPVRTFDYIRDKNFLLKILIFHIFIIIIGRFVNPFLTPEMETTPQSTAFQANMHWVIPGVIISFLFIVFITHLFASGMGKEEVGFSRMLQMQLLVSGAFSVIFYLLAASLWLVFPLFPADRVVYADLWEWLGHLTFVWFVILVFIGVKQTYKITVARTFLVFVFLFLSMLIISCIAAPFLSLLVGDNAIMRQ